MGWTLYEQQRYMWMLLLLPCVAPDTDWNYSDVDWGMLRWQEKLNCVRFGYIQKSDLQSCKDREM